MSDWLDISEFADGRKNLGIRGLIGEDWKPIPCNIRLILKHSFFDVIPCAD